MIILGALLVVGIGLVANVAAQVFTAWFCRWARRRMKAL
jgi:hypothetical protein